MVAKMSRLFIISGIILVFVGLIFHFLPGFGNLPGDLSIKRPNGKILIPITSMVIVSVILTVVINLVLWILSKIK